MARNGRLRILTLILILALCFNFPIASGAAEKGRPVYPADFEPNEIFVRFQPWVNQRERIRASLTEGGGHLQGEIRKTGFSALRLNSQENALAAALRLNQDARVERAEPNYRRRALLVPNDPQYPAQWALLRIEAEQAWEVSTGGDVVIAIVDTGVDLDHPDLASKIVPGYNFVDNNDNPMDNNGHGTHVAGIAAAQSNNGAGVAGVAWSAKIMPIKVLNAEGIGNDSQAAQGIMWAADHGAKIINLSFGGTQYSSLLQEAVNYAHEKGAVVVAAAGNEAEKGNSAYYPAALEHVVAVGALDSNDAKASFSSFGPYLDVSAPGVSILSTTLDNGYGVMSGSSMAAPFVSGEASLLLAQKPGESPDRIEEIIEQTAYDLGESGRDDVFGFGRISLARSLGTSLPTASQGETHGTIQGRIETEGGAAAPGAKVETAGKTATADAGGGFSLTGLSPGVYDLAYSAPGFAKQKQEAIPVGEGTTSVPTVVLSPVKGEITGKVVNSRRKPIGGAAVRIDQMVVPTDSGGRFRFTHLEDGLYAIYYDAPGYKGQRQENITVVGRTTIVPTVILFR